MTALVFAPDSGNQYREFQREADDAALFWGAEIHYFPVSRSAVARRKFILDVIARPRATKITRIAMLSHGFRDHIQAGFDMATAASFAAAAWRYCIPTCVFSLYCCSTGRSSRDDGAGPYIEGEGSYADRMRDELVLVGFRGSTMLTHRTAGHLAYNPDVRIFAINAGELGGDDVALRYPLDRKASAETKAAAWDLYRRFRGLLHTPNGRWEIADMTKAAIEAKARTCAPYVQPVK